MVIGTNFHVKELSKFGKVNVNYGRWVSFKDQFRFWIKDTLFGVII
jgi:hypothetical protein